MDKELGQMLDEIMSGITTKLGQEVAALAVAYLKKEEIALQQIEESHDNALNNLIDSTESMVYDLQDRYSNGQDPVATIVELRQIMQEHDRRCNALENQVFDLKDRLRTRFNAQLAECQEQLQQLK